MEIKALLDVDVVAVESEDRLAVLLDGDPLGVEGFATHRVPLSEGPQAYETFQKKQDGAVKVLLAP